MAYEIQPDESLCVFAAIFLLALPVGVSAQYPLHPHRGVVAGFGEVVPDMDSLNRPAATGQFSISWKELEAEKGQYDFTEVDAQLEKLGAAGMLATVKILTDRHPAYILEEVPALTGDSMSRERDLTGQDPVPVYWLETYRDRYARLVTALIGHLRNSPAGSIVLAIVPDLGLALNDTEHLSEAMEHLEWIHRFHRWVAGDVRWDFQEKAGPQPAEGAGERIAKAFMKQCRTGEAYGYVNAGRPDRTDPDLPRFIYWSALNNLYGGASFMVLPAGCMHQAGSDEGISFFNKYAGYRAHPELSPGVWIAFRGGDTMEGDYSFLMERNKAVESNAVENAGDGIYGLWARRIDSAKTLRLKINQEFVESLDPQIRIGIRIWYLDDNRSVFRIHAFGGSTLLRRPGQGGGRRR